MGLGIGFFETAKYLFDQPWFDGVWLDIMSPVEIADSEAIQFVETQAGVPQGQKVWRDENRSLAYDAKTFSFTFQAGDEAAWYAIKRAKAKGESFEFGMGHRFPVAYDMEISGVYRLPRLRAVDAGVPGITELQYPTIAYVDGVETPIGSVGTFNGAAFTSLVAGRVELIYTPVHKVFLSAVPENVPQFNNGLLPLVLRELAL